MEVINRDSGLSKNQLLFLYLVRQPRGDGFIKIVKTIFKADMEFFKEYRKTITGYTYEKKKNGPVPSGIQKDVDILKKKKYIEEEYAAGHKLSDRKSIYTSSKKLEIITKDFFSDEEMKYIDESRDFVSSLQTHEVVNLFHDNIYNIFDMDEEIPMFMYLSHRGPTEQEKIELMEKYARCV